MLIAALTCKHCFFSRWQRIARSILRIVCIIWVDLDACSNEWYPWLSSTNIFVQPCICIQTLSFWFSWQFIMFLLNDGSNSYHSILYNFKHVFIHFGFVNHLKASAISDVYSSWHDDHVFSFCYVSQILLHFIKLLIRKKYFML